MLDANGQEVTPQAAPPVPVPEAPPQRQSIETAEQTYQRIYGTPPAETTVPTIPLAQTPPAAQTFSLPEEFTQTISQMAQQIADLKAAQAPPPAAATPAAQKLEWVEKIRQGDFEGAQASMQAAISAGLAPQLQNVRQQAYQDAVNATQVNMEMDRHLQSVRLANPDLVQFERYLQAPVAERVQAAQAAGRLRNPQDFLREYKSAVDAEIGTLRNLGLQFRAAGKDEAITRNREVISSQTLTPQQVQSMQQSQAGSQNQPVGETNQDYFARRRADESRRRGLA